MVQKEARKAQKAATVEAKRKARAASDLPHHAKYALLHALLCTAGEILPVLQARGRLGQLDIGG